MNVPMTKVQKIVTDSLLQIKKDLELIKSNLGIESSDEHGEMEPSNLGKYNISIYYTTPTDTQADATGTLTVIEDNMDTANVTIESTEESINGNYVIKSYYRDMMLEQTYPVYASAEADDPSFYIILDEVANNNILDLLG